MSMGSPLDTNIQGTAWGFNLKFTGRLGEGREQEQKGFSL